MIGAIRTADQNIFKKVKRFVTYLIAIVGVQNIQGARFDSSILWRTWNDIIVDDNDKTEMWKERVWLIHTK